MAMMTTMFQNRTCFFLPGDINSFSGHSGACNASQDGCSQFWTSGWVFVFSAVVSQPKGWDNGIDMELMLIMRWTYRGS